MTPDRLLEAHHELDSSILDGLAACNHAVRPFAEAGWSNSVTAVGIQGSRLGE